ncbi:MAG TPA: glycosyltransferase family 4 protein [Ktedonobacterales bacterium]|nr:glycosyltransferase family 4 protein [Ktedonobacterales bacterium]
MSDPERLRVLIVTPSLPYPLVWGFGIRVYQIIKYLAQRHDVSVLAYAGPNDQDSVAALEQTGARIHAVVRDEPSTAAKRQAQLSSLFSPASFQWQSLESRAMQAALDRVLVNGDFDIIQVESSQMTGFDYRSTKAPLLVDEHNIEYELLYRTFAIERSALRKFYNWVEYRKFRHEEQRSWKHSDGCIVTSDREETILRRYSPRTPTLVVPNGVDIDEFRPTPGARDANSVVFVGVMHYRPNVDAALYFAREIMPRLLRERPNLVFTIVGGGPPDELRRLASKNIVVTDRVPDTRPYVARAGVIAIPLRMGSGTRLKVLEGLAMGCPLVSTSVGCEGIAIADGEHLLVADDPMAFARSVLQVLDDKALAASLGHRGRALVEERYSWGSVLRQLESFMWTRRHARGLANGHTGSLRPQDPAMHIPPLAS